VFFVADNIAAAPMNGSDAAHEQDDVIECRRVSKVFGADGQMPNVRKWRDLSKSAIADKFKCIVGVADVSFCVRRGEIFCIMGLSGSGKSTLVRHINRLINPTSGEILVNGERIDLMGAAQLRKLRNETVGMVFQHVALLPHRTVRDNVAFPLELRADAARKRQEIADAKLDLVHLAGWGDRYPDELSGGMQQRVGLARALAADPDILLMDEPFSALDPLIRCRLQDQFLELSCQLRKTTVFITHDLEEALKLGDRIAIMRDGRFVQIGRPEEIVASPADDYVADWAAAAHFDRHCSRPVLVFAWYPILYLCGGIPLAARQPGALGSNHGHPEPGPDIDADRPDHCVSARHPNGGELDGARCP
jgi:glycine betaine/proline transport system ATP-binding protein